jgi:hypothetical protein
MQRSGFSAKSERKKFKTDLVDWMSPLNGILRENTHIHHQFGRDGKLGFRVRIENWP